MSVKKSHLLSGGVTLQAVARAAGVTIATASRSLNDAYGVHPVTRARVLQVAKRLNYTPNRFARGLVTGRSDMIGLIVSDVRNSYFAEVARGVEDAALEAGRDVRARRAISIKLGLVQGAVDIGGGGPLVGGLVVGDLGVPEC